MFAGSLLLRAVGRPWRTAGDGARGFTLVELLIVIGVVGTLMGLALPALNSARESARRMQCANNLKQLALACVHHESAQGHLPTGGWAWFWSGDADRGFHRGQPGGWTYNILPYIEQQPLRDLGRGKGIADKKKDAAVVGQAAVPLFYCPSRRFATTYPNSHNTCNSDPISRAARTDYAANSGTNQNISWNAPRPTTGNPAFFDAGNFVPPNYDKTADGVIYTLSAVSLEAILDNPSYTFLLGEKYLNPDHWITGLDGSDNNPLYSGFDTDWQRWGMGSPLRDRPGVSNSTSFGSSHISGVNMAMCDGAVRHVNYTIDPNVFRRLCGRSNGADEISEN